VDKYVFSAKPGHCVLRGRLQPHQQVPQESRAGDWPAIFVKNKDLCGFVSRNEEPDIGFARSGHF
jgi:hypothetical protein